MATQTLSTSATTSAAPTPNDSRVYVKGADYILPVDKSEVDRFILQHLTIRSAFEDRVLLAPMDKEASLFVLDSGTGSGLWLLDVASQLPPTAILHGIDIEGNRFPAPGPERPRNMSFSVASILELPDTWSGRFDLIHQRLLVCGLLHKDWPTALSQMHRVLSPGGWVQLGEYGGSWGTGPCALEQVRIYDALAQHVGLYMRIYEELPGFLRDAGFVDVHVERRTIPLGARGGERGIRAARHVADFFRALKGRVLAAGGLGLVQTDEDLEKVIVGLEKEWDEMDGQTIDFDIICARKPAIPK